VQQAHAPEAATQSFRRSWFDGSTLKEWLNTFASNPSSGSALLTISACATSVTLLKFLFPDINIMALVAVVTVCAVAMWARPSYSAHATEGARGLEGQGVLNETFPFLLRMAKKDLHLEISRGTTLRA
jgi:hypothetical protein